MPYRIDISSPAHDAPDRLIELGALDIEQIGNGLAAIIPDGVTPDAVAAALGLRRISISQAVARDNGSVWLLHPRSVRIGNIVIAPAESAAPPGALRLIDSAAFGTGHHPTTALCVEALDEIVKISVPGGVLDVGTGSGVLALAALMMAVPRAMGVDIDENALKVASENARLNNLQDRLELVLGGPDVASGVWPLVLANVLAAPLIDMAPIILRRVESRGRLILSGIPSGVETDVRQTYERLGMRHFVSNVRAGWTALVFQASW